MSQAGLYPDPFGRAFARRFTGHQWTYLVADPDGIERSWFDHQLTDSQLSSSPPPDEGDLLSGHPLQWVNRPGVAVHGPSAPPISARETLDEEWVQGFNGRIRLVEDWVEIEVMGGKSKKLSTLLLSYEQDIVNRGSRIIPLRTIQAVHFSPASVGLMGTLQFTVPGALTSQVRSNGGKFLRVLGEVHSTQAHENSITFERSQQSSFEAFHGLVIRKMAEIQASSIPAKAPSSDLATRLRELKGLLDDGILSEEEFSAAKGAILNGQ